MCVGGGGKGKRREVCRRQATGLGVGNEQRCVVGGGGGGLCVCVCVRGDVRSYVLTEYQWRWIRNGICGSSSIPVSRASG